MLRPNATAGPPMPGVLANDMRALASATEPAAAAPLPNGGALTAFRLTAVRLTAFALTAFALTAGPTTALAAPGLTLAPGIAFAWTAPGTEGLLTFRFERGPSPNEPITGVALTARHLTVTGYRLGPDDDRLSLRVRADAPGIIEVPSLLVHTRFAPPQRLRAGAAEVVALTQQGGPLRLVRWTSDDELGLYAAFALVNDSALPVTVRRLRYAPEPLDRGLALVATGPPTAFTAWEEDVLARMAPAFAAFLEGHGRSPTVAARPIPPPSLAFPLRGGLADASWRAPDALSERLEPGAALFVALTPAAFRSYVHDLTIVASPVVGFTMGANAACCELQGVPAAIQHPPRLPPASARPRTAGR